MRTSRIRTVASAVLIAGAVTGGVAACGDSAASVPPTNGPLLTVSDLAGGSTAVRLDRAFVTSLQDAGITITPVLPATLDTDTSIASFPVTGGHVTYFRPGGPVEPPLEGSVRNAGGLRLAAGLRTVELTNLTVDPGASVVYADVTTGGQSGSTQTTLFALNARALEPLQISGGNVVLTGTAVSVSPAAATLLDQALDTDALTPQENVGVATLTLPSGIGLSSR